MTRNTDDEQEQHEPPASEAGQAGQLNRWGGRAILGLQGAYDKLLAGRLKQLQGQVIDQDREISNLVHDLAEMGTQVEQLTRRLQALEEKVAGLEATSPGDDSE